MIEVEVAGDGSTLEQSPTPYRLQELPQHCWPFLGAFVQLEREKKNQGCFFILFFGGGGEGVSTTGRALSASSTYHSS